MPYEIPIKGFVFFSLGTCCHSSFERGCGNQELKETISNQALGLVTRLIQSREGSLR